MKRKKSFVAVLLSLLMVFSICISATYAEDSDGDVAYSWNISKSKQATQLDENYESEITISLPSESYEGDLDVVFVLDGSTSTDQKDLAGQAAALLESLLNYENLNVKAAVVIFGGENPILYNSDLLELDETTCNKLVTEMTDKDYDNKNGKGEGRSGSNLQAGVEAARTLLNGDGDVDMSDKYMIILTDGGARTWYDSTTGEAMSQTYQYGAGSSVKWNLNEDWVYRYGINWEELETNGVSKPLFEDVWKAGQSGVDIGKYGTTKTEYQAASVGDEKVADWNNVVLKGDYYTTYEAACYYAATSIVDASDESNVIMVTYPYYSNTSYTEFTEDFKNWLDTNGYVTRYDSEDADAETIFSNVKDQLIQLVDAGSVIVDEMGETDDYDFDFVNESNSLTLTIDGTEQTVVEIDENKYGFGDKNGSSDETTYPFVLTYYPDGTTYKDTTYGECYVLDINVPITKNNQVKLTYSVKLTNPQSTAGTYGVYDQYGENNDGSDSSGLYTNNIAVLYSVDSNGTILSPEEFLKPTVSYVVEETISGEEIENDDNTSPEIEDPDTTNPNDAVTTEETVTQDSDTASPHATVTTEETVTQDSDTTSPNATITAEETATQSLKTGDSLDTVGFVVALTISVCGIGYILISDRKSKYNR